MGMGVGVAWERKKEVMHGSSEGVLVQEMGCKKVVEVGRGSRGIYRAYRCIYYRGLFGYIIYSCMYSVYWWGDQLGSVIYFGCAMYRNVSYSRYIGLVSIYIRFTVGDMLHIGYISVRSRGMA